MIMKSVASAALDAPAAAIQTPGISQRVDDTFRKAQTERRATQLLTPGETPSPSQLDRPSRRGCGAVPSRWASTVVPGASGEEEARGRAQSYSTGLSCHALPWTCDRFATDPLGLSRIGRYPGTLWEVV